MTLRLGLPKLLTWGQLPISERAQSLRDFTEHQDESSTVAGAVEASEVEEAAALP